MLLLVIVEPNILEAPFENERTLLFTFGGTALAAIAMAPIPILAVGAIIYTRTRDRYRAVRKATLPPRRDMPRTGVASLMAPRRAAMRRTYSRLPPRTVRQAASTRLRSRTSRL